MKKILSLVLLALIVITFAACSGTKNVCPAYSQTDTEISARHGG